MPPTASPPSRCEGWNGTSWIDLWPRSAATTWSSARSPSPPTTTDRIRINVTAARSAGSYLTEIEAWTATGGPGGPTSTTTTLASSLNPAPAGASVTFTATVNGTNPTGNVGFTDNGNAISGCTAVALTGGGNSQHRDVHAPAASPSAPTASSPATRGDAGNAASDQRAAVAGHHRRRRRRQQQRGARQCRRRGLGLEHLRARPTRSSAVNNNERAGTGWGNGGGWADGTPGTFPDWVQIIFNGSKTIDRVVVYSLQDNYTSRSSPPTA